MMMSDMIAYCSETAHVWPDGKKKKKKKSMYVSALMSQMPSLLSMRAEEAEAQAPDIAITTCAGIMDCDISLWSL